MCSDYTVGTFFRFRRLIPHYSRGTAGGFVTRGATLVSAALLSAFWTVARRNTCERITKPAMRRPPVPERTLQH